MGEEADYLESQYVYHKIDDELFHTRFKDTRKPNKDGLYQCTMCKMFKPKSEFYKDNRVPCGIRNKCKKCYHKKAKE